MPKKMPDNIDLRRVAFAGVPPSARLGAVIRDTPDEELLQLSAQAKQEGATYPKKRFVYETVMRHAGERIFIALVGPRGVGKSTILKQIHNQADSSFYITLDAGGAFNLYELAKQLAGRGTKLLLIDEIHAHPNYGTELKKIYDFLPNLQIICTSSSSVSLHDNAYDLSRRVRLIPVYSLSFREFIFFARDELAEPLKFADLNDARRCREYYGKNMHVEPLFENYLAGGNYIFTLGQKDILPQFQNMLDTIIERDLVVISRISMSESFEVRNMLIFIGRSAGEDISYSSIAHNVGISKAKAQKYVEMLEKAFVLKRVLPKGTNVTKEPKILFAPPYRLLFKSYAEAIGALREDFFVDSVSRLGIRFDYLKGTRGEKTPDYLIGNTVFEIGGRNKGRMQFKGISAKTKVILTHPGTLDDMRRPLFFVGMIE